MRDEGAGVEDGAAEESLSLGREGEGEEAVGVRVSFEAESVEVDGAVAVVGALEDLLAVAGDSESESVSSSQAISSSSAGVDAVGEEWVSLRGAGG